ncbi:MAG TPA: serine hydrolase, partial [Leptolyngbyaceae cyanobacterium M65_K2018_010]|nr:serine hydrolase [Leptolyngbyaceae cyanobacterium M65_K2018_010]
FVGEHYENRNRLTTHAVARLVHSIAGGVAVSAARSQAMLTLMQRNLQAERPITVEEDQITGFLGAGLPPQTAFYSKAGFTSQVRHDAAYIEIPGQHPFILVAFTEGREHSQNKFILPQLATLVTEQMSLLPAADLS